MIFAAGFGTRMRPLTDTRPKPLIPVAGQTLLDRTLALFDPVDTDQIVVNAHYLADQVQAHLHGRPVAVSVEHPDILDTGGGLRQALPLLGSGPVIASNSDAIWKGPNPIQSVLAAWQPTKMDALLLCVPIASTVGYTRAGDFELASDGQLSRGRSYVYGGVQILKTDLLETVSQTSFSLNIIWDQMAANNRLFGVSYPGQWADIGHPGGIAEAEALLNV